MCVEIRELEANIDLIYPADLPQLLVIEKESFPAPWTEGMFIGEISNPSSQCLCVRVHCKDKNIIAAYIIFWLGAGEIHLHNLAVKKEFRRQHLATKLLDIMEEIAKKAAIDAITLEVRPSNTAAIELYRKRGFVVKGRRPNYYHETKEDALIMWAYLK
jgi:ribosomal-protein-alanine N-acetyltransferase